ncbi:MAG: protein rep [Candidatus Sedimenticola sp. (ex Thyasira tokunagai)]
MPQIIDQNLTPSQTLLPFPPSPPQHDLKSYYPTGPQRVPVADGPPKEPLGNNTKSAAVLREKSEAKSASEAFRRAVYKLLAAARKIAPKKHRVGVCMAHPGTDKSGKMFEHIDIDLIGDKARFKKVALCGSVSSCPICAPKIMAKRQEEVLIGCRNHRKNGGSTLMVTLTNAHKRNNSLKEERRKLTKALSEMKASYEYKAVKDDYGMIGAVRVIEVTFGKNGWHLHVHEAWFVKGGLTPELMDKLESRLFKVWRKHCKKHKLGLPSRAHGVSVDYRESDDPSKDAVGSYITKLPQELTGGINKESKLGGITYWGMLSELSEQWSLKYERLAKEYMVAMKGMAFTFWSRDLKAILNVEEDMAIAEEERIAEEEPVRDNVKIPVSRWYTVVRAWKHARVLEVMERHGGKAALKYVEFIYKRDTYERKRLDREKSDLRRSINESTVEAMKREGVERLRRVV